MKNLTKQEQINEALIAYDAIRDSADKAYDAIREPAWIAYEEIRRSAHRAYLVIRDPAQKAHHAIADSAWIAYRAKLKEINAIDFQDLLEKYGIQHGLENDQSNIDGFIAEVKKLSKENN